MHYDVIKASDLVNEQNSPSPVGKGTADSAAAVVSFFATFLPLLDNTNPECRRHVDGTFWFMGDLYTLLWEHAERHADDPDRRKFKIIRRGIELDADGVPIAVWSRIPSQQLRGIMEDPAMSPQLWAANYRNQPLPLDSSVSFRREWFKEYDETPDQIIRDNPGIAIVTTVDLAISEKQMSRATSRTAIVTAGYTPGGRLYVLDARAGFWGAGETLDQILGVDEMFKPRFIGIEAVAFQKAMLWVVQTEASRRGYVPPLRPLYPDGGDKDRRAFAMSNFARAHGIWVRREHHEFVDEHVRFGMPGSKNDYVDAMAYRAQFMFKPLRVLRPDDGPRNRDEALDMVEKAYGNTRPKFRSLGA
jgi:hypothetical protein